VGAFCAGVPAGTKDRDLVAAYGDLLFDPDPAVRAKAARDFHDWDTAGVSTDPNAERPARWSDPAYVLTRARIVTHYLRHGAWLEEGALLAGAAALSGIPGVMVQGRLDLQGPLVTAWELSKAWPDARLVVVESAAPETAAGLDVRPVLGCPATPEPIGARVLDYSGSAPGPQWWPTSANHSDQADRLSGNAMAHSYVPIMSRWICLRAAFFSRSFRPFSSPAR
jgi:hypothetical protein